MASMLKKIKSLFVIEEEAPKAKNESSSRSQTSAPAESKERMDVASADLPPSPVAAPGKVTNKFMDVLLGAMAKNNLDGFDYLEFKQSLKSLSEMPMDEKTRFQSAFAMAQTMGATPDLLINTANHYLNVLQKEEKKFEQAVDNQRKKQIGNKEKEIKQMDMLIQEKAEQIKRLTQEIEQHRKLRDKLTQQISQSAVKVETTKNNFIASYQALVSQIQADIEQINKYLK